jgi:hypothetical protein
VSTIMQRCRVVRNEEWFCNSILSFSVRKAIRVVHTGRRSPSIVSKDAQGPLFIDIGEV